ncbi:MAG: DNA polymerase III subunit beta [Enterobacterales bacterium]
MTIFKIERELLINPLKKINSSLSNRYNLFITNNLLIKTKNNNLFLIGTDLEIEIIACIYLSEKYINKEITVDANKFYNICNNMPTKSTIQIQFESKFIIISSKNSKYFLSSQSSINFPKINYLNIKAKFSVSNIQLKNILESVYFAMANNDARYFLNGMLLEIDGKILKAVATNGHRLAINYIYIENTNYKHSLIIPRKGIIELMRILGNVENFLKIEIYENNIKINFKNYVFTSKLIDGSFPNYNSIITNKFSKILQVNCKILKEACVRASILSNDKIKIIYFELKLNKLKIISNNQLQEKSEETIDVIYNDKSIKIALNVNYIIDVLKHIKSNDLKLMLTDERSSVHITDTCNKNYIYIVMPIRL